MILKCVCKHPFQDKKYGKGMRVYNPTLKGSETARIYRCTVCLNERGAVGVESIKK